jgi:hypothetical protein
MKPAGACQTGKQMGSVLIRIHSFGSQQDAHQKKKQLIKTAPIIQKAE